LEIENRHNEVVNILRILEPNLKRLFVGITERRKIIYGDIGIDHPIPLPLMGDGMLHALSIALAMVNNQNGLVLIDEIENGLHYSVLTDIWKMIFQTSLKLNVQVFVATHSDECIKAAYEAVESLECYDSLKLYRFDRIKDGTRVEDYTANELYSAITSNQEVR
jgi:AAA15 family ATPase/GTPase